MLKCEINFTEMEIFENPQKIFDALLDAVGNEAEGAMKERSAILTGRLMNSIKPKYRTKHSVIVGSHVEYGSHANIVGRWKSGKHGPRFIERTGEFMGETFPKLFDVILHKFSKEGGKSA